ncbi:MAG: cyclic nucleotide-binding domain-containing protein [Myxococcota bacterium]
MDNLDRILKDQPFLSGLSADQLEFMAGCARNVVFADGDVLFRDGQEGDSLFIIREGQVALEINTPPHGRRVVETLERGDIIGWSWLFPPYKWHIDGRAQGSVRAIRFDGECLRNKLEQDNILGYALAKKLLAAAHQRLERVRLQKLDIFGKVSS